MADSDPALATDMGDEQENLLPAPGTQNHTAVLYMFFLKLFLFAYKCL